MTQTYHHTALCESSSIVEKRQKTVMVVAAKVQLAVSQRVPGDKKDAGKLHGEQSRLLSVNNWKHHDIYVHKYMNIYVTFMNVYI
jgi:hypothetical protein